MAINKKEEFTLIMVFIKTNKNKQLIEQKTYIYIILQSFYNIKNQSKHLHVRFW